MSEFDPTYSDEAPEESPEELPRPAKEYFTVGEEDGREEAPPPDDEGGAGGSWEEPDSEPDNPFL